MRQKGVEYSLWRFKGAWQLPELREEGSHMADCTIKRKSGPPEGRQQQATAQPSGATSGQYSRGASRGQQQATAQPGGATSGQ